MAHYFSFAGFRLSTLLVWLAVLYFIRTTGASTSSISRTPLTEHRHSDEPNNRITFRHRHSFNYYVDPSRSRLFNFQVIDTQDMLRHATSSSSGMASFELRPGEHRPSTSKHRNPDTQQALELEHKFTAPNITDKQTVVNLAKMTSDAYIFDPGESGWLNTSLGFNFTSRFGWSEEGLRGHVFTTEDNSTVVVSFKGTTIDPRDKLSGRDRINDNKLFSCCCGAQNPWRYAPVCNCSTGFNQCDSNCLTSVLLQNDTYYDAALYMFNEFQSRYPGAAFWTTGHSLGGSLASLIGMTLNIPAVTFEAPPERLPAQRMGLIPAPTTERHTAYHFGNTGDPIYMGECNGLLSACAIWGFVFDSKCSTGSRCEYDTRKDKGWSSNVGNHRINYVIENVLQAYDSVPKCEAQAGCVDCADWNFSESSLNRIASRPDILWSA